MTGVRAPARPPFAVMDDATASAILDEAFEVLERVGISIAEPDVVTLLSDAGASIAGGRAFVPRDLVRRAARSAPKTFALFDRAGQPVVRYGAGGVYFDPGSSCAAILDARTMEHRPSTTADLVRLVKVVEMLPQFAAQSTAMLCGDVPEAIGDLFRLAVVLEHSDKPIITGAFTAHGVPPMVELLAADAGGADALRRQPRAVFDVCPSPPLHWTRFAASNLVDLGRAGVPAEIVSVPLAGAAAPVTLAGAVVQHTAECLGGLAIHQTAAPGAPVVWGGAPSIFDMRTGAAPMGAIETAMLNSACAQVGKLLGLPTHGYVGGSDAKTVDVQAGIEVGAAIVVGTLAGIDMMSGAGMLASLACHSVEKLVVDAEAIAMALRLARGLAGADRPFGLDAIARAGAHGEFLKLPETRRLFRGEQILPSAVVDRTSLDVWRQSGGSTAFDRARSRAAELEAAYRRPDLCAHTAAALRCIVERHAAARGVAIPRAAWEAFA